MILRNGQGHDFFSADGVDFEVAWYRQSDQDWNIWLAVETAQHRVEAPGDTKFTCEPGRSTHEHEKCLSRELAEHLNEMLQAA